MNTTELIETIRQEVFIDGDGSSFPDFGDARLCVELTDELRTTFARAITQARCGYWLKQHFVTVTPGTASYQIPERAVTGGLESVAIADGAGRFVKLDEVSETHSLNYERAPGEVGAVQKYVIRGDQVVLLPTPYSSCTLRLSYYLRPSQLVAPQSAGLVSGITVEPDGRTKLTCNEIPINQLTGTELGTDDPGLVDVVHPTGWAEVRVVSAINSPDSSTPGVWAVRFDAGLPMTGVAVGDYVRVANQSEWPCLPEDFHRTLAKAAAVKVMQQLHMLQKADVTAAQVNADLQRFADLLTSRVKSEARVLKAPSAVLQVGRSHRGFYGWR